MTEIYPQISPMTKPTHPKLEEYFHQWRELIYKIAHQFAKRYRQPFEEFLGFCVIKLNECLHLWNPTKGGQFNTYYIQAMSRCAPAQFMKYESEHSRLYHQTYCATKSPNPTLRLNNLIHIDWDKSFDVPAKEEANPDYMMDLEAVIKKAETILTEKEYYVLTQRVVHKVELRNLARQMKLNKQYVSQIYHDAVVKLRKELNK